MVDLHIHLLLHRSLLSPLKLPTAKRQGLFLLFFLSIWLVAGKREPQNKTKQKTQS